MRSFDVLYSLQIVQTILSVFWTFWHPWMWRKHSGKGINSNHLKFHLDNFELYSSQFIWGNWLFCFLVLLQVLCYTSHICPGLHRPQSPKPLQPTRLNPAAAPSPPINPTALIYRPRRGPAMWIATVGWSQAVTEATRTRGRKRRRRAPCSHEARCSSWRQLLIWSGTCRAPSGLAWPHLSTSQKPRSRSGFRTDGTNGNVRSLPNWKPPTWPMWPTPRCRPKPRRPKGWFESPSCTMRTSPQDPYQETLVALS